MNTNIKKLPTRSPVAKRIIKLPNGKFITVPKSKNTNVTSTRKVIKLPNGKFITVPKSTGKVVSK